MPRHRLGVGGVGFAEPAAELTVGTVHLHHLDADAVQVAGETGAVAARTLYSDPYQVPVGLKPFAHLLIAEGIGWERRRS